MLMWRIPWVTAVLILGLAGCGDDPGRQPAAEPDREAGAQRVDDHGVDQVWVPPGRFIMGTADTTGLDPPRWARVVLESELPAHPVRITRGFWMDRTEVTNRAYLAFVADGGYDRRELWSDSGWAWRGRQEGGLPLPCDEELADHPRTCVTWYEAQAYARWRGGRLPTDAEWEFAARGPGSSVYPWGNDWNPGRANVVDSDGTTPVGSYPDGQSWVGAVDMAGNAMEWVSDWLSLDYYTSSEMVDPQGPDSGRVKIEKGGWWGSNPFVARSAYHHFEDPPEYRDHHIGFRIVTDEPAGPPG